MTDSLNYARSAGQTARTGPAPVSRTHTAVVGLQWGDEGKGKIVDILTADHDVVVRYNGGANAGHSVVVDGQRYALHLIPSGILYRNKLCVIGNGVVVDPEKFVEEVSGLRARGVEVADNLKVSDRAHVVMPYHREHDAALERVLSQRAAAGDPDLSIGTTRRGIGPAYADKVHRSTAIRVGELLDPDRLRRRLDVVCRIRSAELAALGVEAPPLDPAQLAARYAELGLRLAPHVVDTAYLLHDCVRAGRSILFEGANACLLDIDHGTYPYVTSSSTSTSGIHSGTGVPGSRVGRVVGIMKAYTTRVGAGPFPTELLDATGQRIRDRGREYGTTTGRPRRCGWLDLVAVRYSAMICGATELAVMLLDVLSGLDTILVCTRYRLPDGRVTDRFIPDGERLADASPVYEKVEGWREEITDAARRDTLPAAARRYLDLIERETGVPVRIVSVGPERRQTLADAAAPLADPQMQTE